MKSIPGNTSRNDEKGGIRKKIPHPGKEKRRRLTRHFSAMDFLVQAPGNWMVPRQCFGPIPQLFPPTASEQGALTFLTHWEVAQQLQHVKQYGDWHGIQDY